jgi:hypothetical protein
MGKVLGAVGKCCVKKNKGKKREQCLRGTPKENQGEKQSTEEKKSNT